MPFKKLGKHIANRHPGKSTDEVFVGNHDLGSFKRLTWTTKRASADIPYEPNGQPSDRPVMPVYVKIWEIKRDPNLTSEEKAAYLNS